jgi:hypothetical protein
VDRYILVLEIAFSPSESLLQPTVDCLDDFGRLERLSIGSKYQSKKKEKMYVRDFHICFIINIQII